jgi:hypothetical protein
VPYAERMPPVNVTVPSGPPPHVMIGHSRVLAEILEKESAWSG